MDAINGNLLEQYMSSRKGQVKEWTVNSDIPRYNYTLPHFTTIQQRRWLVLSFTPSSDNFAACSSRYHFFKDKNHDKNQVPLQSESLSKLSFLHVSHSALVHPHSSAVLPSELFLWALFPTLATEFLNKQKTIVGAFSLQWNLSSDTCRCPYDPCGSTFMWQIHQPINLWRKIHWPLLPSNLDLSLTPTPLQPWPMSTPLSMIQFVLQM